MTDIVERMRSENMVWSVSEAADEIERLREAFKHILTHCESDTPPNAEALILFVNKTLEEGNDIVT